MKIKDKTLLRHSANDENVVLTLNTSTKKVKHKIIIYVNGKDVFNNIIVDECVLLFKLLAGDELVAFSETTIDYELTTENNYQKYEVEKIETIEQLKKIDIKELDWDSIMERLDATYELVKKK